MPGAFAHITLVNMLKEPRRLDALGGFPVTPRDSTRICGKRSRLSHAILPLRPRMCVRLSELGIAN